MDEAREFWQKYWNKIVALLVSVIGGIALIVMEALIWQGFFVIINHRIMSLMLRIPKFYSPS